ncbi:hypothetical protein Tco_1064192, partial [Tanacetum coccineum]
PNRDAKLGIGGGVMEGLVVVVVVTGTLTKVVDDVRGFRIESIPSSVIGEMNFETRSDTDELCCWTTGVAAVRVTWASFVSSVVSASVMSRLPPYRATFVTSPSLSSSPFLTLSVRKYCKVLLADNEALLVILKYCSLC